MAPQRWERHIVCLDFRYCFPTFCHSVILFFPVILISAWASRASKPLLSPVSSMPLHLPRKRLKVSDQPLSLPPSFPPSLFLSLYPGKIGNQQNTGADTIQKTATSLPLQISLQPIHNTLPISLCYAMRVWKMLPACTYVSPALFELRR